ncbi:hypothetical protein hamaS1_07070 [Moorella sp. Hama-1]|nr:hypothetical protein hamaS1_07070 [Moorella sp. Hama-1]
MLKRIATVATHSVEKSNPNQIKRTIDHLRAKNIIEKNRARVYAFVEPMFHDYLLREFF